MNIENYIESQYREISEKINIEFTDLYKSVLHNKLREIFSTLHHQFVTLFKSMNSRLPTNDLPAHFWADPSRELIAAIDMAKGLKKALNRTNLAFQIEPYYEQLLEKCSQFLSCSGGSTIPEHMEKVEIYYTIPIFIYGKSVTVDAPTIKIIDHDYIKGLARRAREDIERANYDSAITKCRTLIEEVFYHVIEMKGETPSESGDISVLYKHVKTLYNMHQVKEADVRINMLLSGLEKILTSISKMRNKDGDAHGVGSKRINIDEHHARLFLNSAIALSDFILAVAEKNKTKEATT